MRRLFGFCPGMGRPTVLAVAAFTALSCVACTSNEPHAPNEPPPSASTANALHGTPQATAAQAAVAAMTENEPAPEDEYITSGDRTFHAVAFSGQTTSDAGQSTVIIELYKAGSGPNPIDWANNDLGTPNGTWTVDVNGTPVELIHYNGAQPGDLAAISVIGGISGDVQFRMFAFSSTQNEADRVAATLYAHFAAA